MPIAYCGLECDQCEIFAATVRGNGVAKQKLAEQYSTPSLKITAADLECFGCKSSKISDKICSRCPIRQCAGTKNIHHCAECAEYPCKTVEKNLPLDHVARKELEQLRNQL